MFIKETVIKFYHKTSFRVIAGILVVAMVGTMFIQSATLVAISRSDSDAAVNYLAENTEYVNKNTPQRVEDYLKTLGTKDTLEDYYRLASTQIAREEYNDALGNIEKCISLYNNEGKELYEDLLLKRGCLQVMIGDYDAALKSLDLALAKDPAAADIYLVKAQIFAQRQNMGALAQCLTEYLKLVPEDSSIRALLAQAQFTGGDYEAAAQQYAEIIDKDPNAEVEYLYGLNAVKNSDFAAAEASLTSAIAKDDSFDGIYYYRGVCRMSLGNYPAAIKDLTVSIEREDMLQASYYTRGVCLLMDNQYEKGLMDIEYAANGNDDEGVTKQAQLLIAELEAAQSLEKVQLVKTAQPGEIALPEATLPPETKQSLN
ncbi:MAG: tetratricopeptide repeat protein [Methanocorpusculum sp.]|nr:tetratricopeptide repeat protein [Methanocorpusculum sp.]